MFRFVLSILLLSGMTCLLSAETAPGEAKGHSDLIHTIAFSPDGKTFATGGFDKEIKIWDYANGNIKEIKTLSGHTDPVYCVVYLPDGKRLASSSHDRTIRIWNLADGKTLQQLKGHNDIVDTIAVSPDGKLLASGCGGADKSVRLWNPDGGKEVKNLGTHNGTVHSVAFSPDGKLLASGGADNVIKIWDVPGQKELMQLKGHELGVTGVVFAGDNKTLVSVSQDRTLRVWDLDAKDTTPKVPETISVLVGGQMRIQMKSKKDIKAAMTDKPAIAGVDPVKSEPTFVILRGVKEGTCQVDLTDGAGNKESYTVVVKPDPKAAKDGKKDAKKDEPKKDAKDAPKKDEKDFHEIKKFGPTPDDLYAVAWSKEAKAILTAGYAGNISLWDLKDPKPKFTKKLKSLAYCVTFSPDGKSALSGHLNGFVYVTPLK